MIVLLDTGPLGLVTNPRATAENDAARQWIAALAAGNVRVLVPEIADYELRRELLRIGRTRGLAYLDRLEAIAGYVSISTGTMRRAAELWAQARRAGMPTAPDQALDGDVILAAASPRRSGRRFGPDRNDESCSPYPLRSRRGVVEDPSTDALSQDMYWIV